MYSKYRPFLPTAFPLFLDRMFLIESQMKDKKWNEKEKPAQQKAVKTKSKDLPPHQGAIENLLYTAGAVNCHTATAISTNVSVS